MFLISGCVDFIFLLNKSFILFSMDSLEQWRAAIGTFASCISFKNCKFQKCEDGTMSHECMKCLSLIVYTNIIAMLLIVSGNVELNPGPTKKCPKYENSVANRVKKCNCGHVFLSKCEQSIVRVKNERAKVSMRLK